MEMKEILKSGIEQALQDTINSGGLPAGEYPCLLYTSQRGTLVTLGVWWQSQSSDPNVGINVLTADRPTDQGWGSTFYDVQVHIKNCLLYTSRKILRTLLKKRGKNKKIVRLLTVKRQRKQYLAS